MADAMFSFYDLTLVILFAQWGLLSVNTYASPLVGGHAKPMFAAFALILAFIFLNQLQIGLQPFGSVWFYLCLKVLGFVAGPILFFAAQASRKTAFVFHWGLLLHFLPLFFYPIYLVLLWLSLERAFAGAAMQKFDVLYGNPFFLAVDMSMMLSLALYAYCTLVLLDGKRDESGGKENDSVLTKLKTTLSVVFSKLTEGDFIEKTSSAIVVFAACQIFVVVFLCFAATQNIGLMFAVLTHLAFWLFNSWRSPLSEPAVEKPQADENKTVEQEKEPYRDEQVDRIIAAMEQKQLYLNPELTLEQLAEHAQIPPRMVSTIINRRFNKNFFEFTNSYRVDHAKGLLRATDKSISMLDVMADSGFNSKSAFNRFFKKYTEMTPTQYRQSQKTKPG